MIIIKKRSYHYIQIVVAGIITGVCIGIFFYLMKGRHDADEVYSEKTVYVKSSEKTVFADEKDKMYLQAVSEGRIKSSDLEEVRQLMESAVWVEGKELESYSEKLEEYGLYIFQTSAETCFQ